jgi:hypothetical protein
LAVAAGRKPPPDFCGLNAWFGFVLAFSFFFFFFVLTFLEFSRGRLTLEAARARTRSALWGLVERPGARPRGIAGKG